MEKEKLEMLKMICNDSFYRVKDLMLVVSNTIPEYEKNRSWGVTSEKAVLVEKKHYTSGD